MRDVSQYLQAILNAIYGEQVRGSIHDALEAFWRDLNDICLGADGYRYETPGDALRAQIQNIKDDADDKIDEILDSYDEWYQHLRQEFTTYRDALKHILNEGSMEEPVEVLENGSFEDGFDNWDHPSSGMTIETDSDGNYVHCTASTQWGAFKQQFAFSEPGNYLISFKVKGNVTMELVNNNWDHDIIGPQMYNPSYWAPISLPITVGSGQLLNCAITFFHDGSSDWSVRNISILQQASTLDTLANNINSIALNVDSLKTQMDIISYDNISFHNSVFRGKSLGSELTTAQKSAIHEGTFDDMFIGDYWTIGGTKYRIAHFDYYADPRPTAGGYIHHIVLVPDLSLQIVSYYPFSTSVEHVASAYGRSQLRSAAQVFGYANQQPPAAYYYLQSIAFKQDIYLPYGIKLDSSVPIDIHGSTNNQDFDGRYSVFNKFSDSWVELLNEHMIFGSYMTSYVKNYIYTNGGMRQNLSKNNRQLALFALAGETFMADATPYGYWLSDTIGDTVSYVNQYGEFRPMDVSDTTLSIAGIRPYITICGEE